MVDSPYQVTATSVPRALVIMGVSGSGKTDTSLAVAAALGYRHIEADHFHSEANVRCMRDGIALSDAQRLEWLHKLIVEMQNAVADGTGFVLACSALKRSYRDLLRTAVDDLRFAHLSVDLEVARLRVGSRADHFMPISLVDSQFATLEAPNGEPGVLTVDASRPRQVVVEQIVEWMHQEPGFEISEAEQNASQPFDSANKAIAFDAPLTSAPIYRGKVAQHFDRITDWLMAALLAFMVIVVFSSVVLRYVFGTGWTGAEELSRLAFVWLVFVGVASSMRRGELMAFSMIRNRFPQLFRRIVDSLSWLLVVLASGLAAMGGWNQMQFGWSINSPVVGYPLALGMLPVMVGMVALGVLALVQLMNVWRRSALPPPAQANVTAD